jgi:hypothetical protein
VFHDTLLALAGGGIGGAEGAVGRAVEEGQARMPLAPTYFLRRFFLFGFTCLLKVRARWSLFANFFRSYSASFCYTGSLVLQTIEYWDRIPTNRLTGIGDGLPNMVGIVYQ